MYLFFFFKQKTAYEMRISYWSSDVCSSDLFINAGGGDSIEAVRSLTNGGVDHAFEVIGLKSTSEQSIKMARKGGGAYLIGVHKPDAPRSEERRVGKECVRTGRSPLSPYPSKNKNTSPTSHVHNPQLN